MNCSEARRLINQGVTPGSAGAERAALGFHLAGCPACRDYRAGLQDRLLADLLSLKTSVPPPVPLPPSPALGAAPVPPRRRVDLSPRRLLWFGGLGVLGAITLGVVIVIGWAALSIFHTHQNVQAMIVPTPIASSAPTAPPTAPPTPAPTASPRPRATPTLPPPTTVPTPSAVPPPTAPPATATPSPPPPGGPVNILLLGSDHRPGEDAPARTDAIIIARIDPQLQRIALLSLPRDLWAEIPGYGYSTRINAAHVLGEQYGGPGGGAALARETVSNLLGIPIHYTVYVDFEGFAGAIDALGGITVNVEKELYDPTYPTMDHGYTEVYFPLGPQHMDGATALIYSRIRHPDNDFARMRRQQEVLAGIMARLREQHVLQNIKSIEDISTALRSYVRTDLPEERMIGLVWALRDFQPGQIERYVLDEDMVTFGIGDDRWAEVALPGAIEELVQKLLGAAAH